ncbi:MAG: SMC-Scp complex subunit ScpB [Phycisphaerales bacterium]
MEHADTAQAQTDRPDASHPSENADGRVGELVEAVLISVDRPMTAGKIAEALALGADVDGPGQVDRAVAELNEAYERTGRAFRIERVAGGFRLMTLPDFAPVIAGLRTARDAGRLSRPAVETLAIVAYRQPITRADLEAIRGVSCGEVLKTLLERRLVAIAGRAEEPGRPILYGTTKRFLEVFGLSSIKDLPKAGELHLGDPQE